MGELVADRILSGILRLGDAGPEIRSGDADPTIDGIDAPLGSFYVCRVDSSWWRKSGADRFGWVRSMSYVAAPNGESTPILAGSPIALVAGMARLASAADFSRAIVVGIAALGADPTLNTQILPAGILTLDALEWQLITGEDAGLTSGAAYYLGLELGTLTTTPPSGQGQIISELGQATSATSLLVARRSSILL